MISEAPPIFVPSGKGFKAVYNLTFATDLNHHIYLGGMIQGSGVEAKTLKVDNSANGASCSIQLRGAVIPVPPYATQYIDCSGALDVVVTAGTNVASIPLEVLTYKVAEQTIITKAKSVGSKPPVSFNFAYISQLYNTPLKICGVGGGITAYFDLVLRFYINNATGAYWGNSPSSISYGLVTGSGGDVLNSINVDCTNQELWVIVTGPSGYPCGVFGTGG